MKIIEIFKKVLKWYYNSFINDNYDSNVPLIDLKWLPKDIYTDKPESFGLVDSIQFNIKDILTKEEIVLEVVSLEQAKEVIQKCVAQT